MTERISVTVREASDLTGIGMTKLRAAVRSCQLQVRYIGSRNYVIPLRELERYVDSLPDDSAEAS